jgi:Uncharacterized protein conserved in bacteria
MSKRTKVALAAGLAALLVFGFWWNSLLTKMASVAQAQLVAKANENVNGTVTIGKMEFSIFGTLTANAVTVSDRHNAVAGRSERIAIRFGLGDLLTGHADLSAVKSVTLENTVITLASGADGRWNWEDLLKTRQDQEMVFRGTVDIKQGMILVRSAGEERKLETINVTVDFARYPTLSFDLTAKSGGTPLAATGAWAAGGDGEATIKADQVSLADLPLGLLGAGDVSLTGGTAKKATLTVKKQAGKFSLAAEGTLEKLAAAVAGYTLSEGSGKLTMADGKVTLKDGAVLVNGQQVTAGGSVTLDENGLGLDLDLASAAFDPGAVAATPLTGPLAFQAKLTGTPSDPRAGGSFSIAQGSFGAVSFTNGGGNFTYAGGALTLSDTQATAWDGTLTVQGDVVPATQQYQMTASGRGMDSAPLTEKDIRGRMDFDARLSGQGTSGGYAAGSFRMGEGSFSGIPFLSMTGDFTKQGEQMSFYNIVVNTAAGSFRADGTSIGSIIKLRQLDSPTFSQEALEKTVTDKVESGLKKLLRR